MDDPDVALMQAFARGREDAFVQLYDRHRDRIVNYARRILRNEAQAEEAAQDVFLKLYRARDSYTPRSRFSTFLYRIATNHCLNIRARVEHKLVARDVEAADRPDSSTGAQERALDRKALRTHLEAALGTLPDRQRAALVLVHYEGMSYREAAKTIDVTESAMKSLVHRARATMIRELEPWLGDAAKEVGHAM
ncbi:MAG: RNA polymerase sigma factor [Myxococcales bacterium]|jgi:RNA polymerase sigma-70 factor (ECF subfamily)